MKVTTELKNLIKRKFKEKENIYVEEQKQLMEEARNKRIKEIENSKEYKDYVDATNIFENYLNVLVDKYPYKDRFDNGFYYTSNYLSAKNANDFTYNTTYSVDVSPITEQMERVLIRLTYEKDFEKVVELLAEYGIDI